MNHPEPDNAASFVLVNDDGYPELRHYPTEDDDHGCHVRFADSGTNLDELMDAARGHQCETEGGQEFSVVDHP